MGAVSDLFSIGRSALNAYSTALATTSHNVANAATPGFSRQRVDLVNQPPNGAIGNGVQAAQVRRINDTYLQSRLTDDGAAASRHGTARDLLIRADKMLSDPLAGLAAPLQTFNTAVQGLMADPASLSARRVVLAEAQGMTDRFAQLDTGFAQLDREIDGRMASTVSAANGLIDNITKLNQRIAQSTGGAGGCRRVTCLTSATKRSANSPNRLASPPWCRTAVHCRCFSKTASRWCSTVRRVT